MKVSKDCFSSGFISELEDAACNQLRQTMEQRVNQSGRELQFL